MKKSINGYYKVALATAGATFILIFIGGLVRVSGAGMGCPDWPKCYGMWIPPTTAAELPPTYDAASFNPVLTWVEYINRLCGALYGLFILALVFQTFRVFNKNIFFIGSALSVLFLTGVQAWLGKVVVDTDLKPVMVTLHLLFALIMLLIIIVMTQKAYYLKVEDAEKNAQYPKGATFAVGMMLGLIALQIFFGTQVREALEKLEKAYPLFTEKEWVRMIGKMGYIHGILGTALVVGTWALGYRLIKSNISTFSEKVVYAMMSLTWAQLIFGMSLLIIGIPEFIQLFHQWVSSIYLTLCLMLLLAMKQAKRLKNIHPSI